MDINKIKKNSEAELDGDYEHLFVSMLGIGEGVKAKKMAKNKP